MAETTIDPAAETNALIDRYGRGEDAVWNAIAERARTCPVLRRCVVQVQLGDMSKVEALALGALYLSFELERSTREEANRLARQIIRGDQR